MADRTEAPTGQRINKARVEGQVARSVELNSAAIMLLGVFLLAGPGQSLVTSLKAVLVDAIVSVSQVQLSDAWLGKMLINDLLQIVPTLGVIMVLLLATGSLVTLAQTRFLWAGKKLGFDLGRLNPLNNLKRFTSGRGWIELGRSILKLGVVGWVAYGFLTENVRNLLQLGQTDLASGIGAFINLAIALATRVGGIYLILAIVDYVYQRWSYYRGLRMTKEEVKEEYKQQEGNPLIKGKIRAEMRRLARMRMMAAVPKANVVITNPTHLAVAIMYDHASMAAPKLVAKGANLVAFRIADIARENNVPVIQNVPLARAIYKTVEIDQEIPPELYAAMAEVLVYVYKLKGQTIQTANQPSIV